MIRSSILCLLSLVVNYSLVRAETGVNETLVEHFNYIPGVFNDYIGVQNISVKPSKIIMRSSTDEGSMIRWEIPVGVENWSFVIDFNELNLSVRESAGLYLFYTKEKPVLGHFKGGPSIFHGLMTGIEFLGKSVDLLYAKNDGTDFTNLSEYVTKVDSLNPQRFVDVHSLKMKVICTKKNIKIELYNKDTILYDNFKFLSKSETESLKKGSYISLFAEYRNVSSSKAFEITSAQLYEREESADYNPSAKRMIDIETKIKSKSEIVNSNTEINELLFKISAITSYAKSVLGDLPDTTISKSETELFKEIEVLRNRINKVSNLKSTKSESDAIAKKVNSLDLKIKQLLKQMSEINILLDNIPTNKDKKYSVLEYLVIISGAFAASVLVFKESKEFFRKRDIAGKK